jgi:glycosyltransferase involved in cell wall biosynthesis
MKVVLINFSDADGGAARATLRLHLALLIAGIDSVMVVCKKETGLASVVGPSSKFRKGLNLIRPSLDQLPLKVFYNQSSQLFSPSIVPGIDLEKLILDMKPDVLHLHWVNGGMMRVEELQKIKIPICWSLHDMWAFTGGCHYTGSCVKYKSTCNKCPALISGAKKDLSSIIQKKKIKSYSKKKNITVIGLSKWMADEAKESQIFANSVVVNLPNPIDTNTFSPINKSEARKLLGLPENKKLILFGAMSATQDRRKGWPELREALKNLPDSSAELIIFGSSRSDDDYIYPLPVMFLGSLHDDLSLKILYSACDVMVVPSRQENLANTIMEALACGLPVVGFDIGGNSDMVNHKVNGYLAEPYSSYDLARGISWVIEHESHESLSLDARVTVLERFESQKVAAQYIELYQRMIRSN